MKEIPLSSRKYPGLVAFVDDDVYGKVMDAGPWRPSEDDKTFYAKRDIRVNGRRTTQRLHNFVAELYGLPKSPDHANRDGLDNRRCNLRPATLSQQQGNQGLRSDNTSGYKGVYWHRASGKWKAHITIGGRNKYLGYFDIREDAARAYNKAAIEHFGIEFAELNCVNGVPL